MRDATIIGAAYSYVLINQTQGGERPNGILSQATMAHFGKAAEAL